MNRAEKYIVSGFILLDKSPQTCLCWRFDERRGPDALWNDKTATRAVFRAHTAHRVDILLTEWTLGLVVLTQRLQEGFCCQSDP